MLDEAATVIERDEARYAALAMEPTSPAALELTNALAAKLWSEITVRKRTRPGLPFTCAVGALLGDVLSAALWNGRYSWRPMRPEGFTGERVGYTTFKGAYEALFSLGYLHKGRGGHQQRWETDDLSPVGSAGIAWSRAGRFRATRTLLGLAASFGVKPEDCATHFTELPWTGNVSIPIIRRMSSTTTASHQKRKGSNMPIYRLTDGTAAKLCSEVEAINGCLARHTIGPMSFRGLQRIFNEGEKPGFDWNKGGRLYAVGGSYQQLSKEERRLITIDGLPCAELDIRASFLTLLHADSELPFYPDDVDPYLVPGIPRDVVKAFVTMTLGQKSLHKRWPKGIADKFLKEHGNRLQDEYPIKPTRDAVLQALPVLASWATNPLTCFELQYLESRAIVATVMLLMSDYDIPCYPVHDSIIVPLSKLSIAGDVLRSTFRDLIGVYPTLKF